LYAKEILAAVMLEALKFCVRFFTLHDIFCGVQEDVGCRVPETAVSEPSGD
jgi:hypothetical protein